MKHIVTPIILIMFGMNIFAQNRISEATLSRFEKLLLHHEIAFADSLFQQERLSHGNSTSSYQEDYILGLLLYHKEMYVEAVETMTDAMMKMDNLKIWDCTEYMKVAYYIADSYIRLNKLKESESVINYSLVKCASSYSTCIYAKKMYQLLLLLYKDMGRSPSVIEQVHNEIQKIAVNIYALDSINQDGEKIKESFMFFYNLITRPISSKDSLYMYEGKASYLYSIGEYEEAIRLYEMLKEKKDQYEGDLLEIDKSLLVMYSNIAQKDSIESLLRKMYEYSEIRRLGYDTYSLNVWVGYNLHQNGHFELAQSYYERCDSFLNANQLLSDWIEKKKNVLSKMVLNSLSLGSFEKTIKCCEEYEKISDANNYDEYVFIKYNSGFSLLSLGKYKEAIPIFELLKKHIQSSQKTTDVYYVETNCDLGLCYLKNNQLNEAIDCTSIALDAYKSLEMNDRMLLSALYNNLGKAYMLKGYYKKALPLLNLSADIQIEQTGRVTPKTQSYIDNCNKKEK